MKKYTQQKLWCEQRAWMAESEIRLVQMALAVNKNQRCFECKDNIEMVVSKSRIESLPLSVTSEMYAKWFQSSIVSLVFNIVVEWNCRLECIQNSCNNLTSKLHAIMIIYIYGSLPTQFPNAAIELPINVVCVFALKLSTWAATNETNELIFVWYKNVSDRLSSGTD